MLDNITYFIKGITTIKYDVPIYLQITGFITLGVLVTCIILIFGNSLNNSYFKDKYLYYYFLVILNIINIVVVLYYYNYKKGSFIGEEGEKGGSGLKGKVGSYIDCSLCTHNLYLKNTQTYDTICRLDTSKYIDRLLGNTSNNTLITELMNKDTFNYEQFATSLLIDGFDMENPSVISIFNYINAFEFLLYNNINSSLGTSNSRITGYFRRPDIALGYYILGDTVMGGSEEYKITSFGLNGDIILPQGFNQICSFTTITENGNIEQYGIYKMIPPEWQEFTPDDIPENERDLSKQPKNDEYLSLGYVVSPLTNSDSPDKKLFACVKKSCCRKMKKQSLKFMFIYPAVGFSDNDIQKDKVDSNDVSNGVSNVDDVKLKLETSENVMGMFSVWRTPYNTLYVKYMDSTRLINGKTIIEQLFLNMNNGDIDESLYTRYGTIKKIVIEKVKSRMKKIRLNKIVILGILFSHTFENVSRMLKSYYSRYIGGGTSEIPNATILKDLISNSPVRDINYNDIHLLIKEIEKSVNIKKSELNKMEQRKQLEIKKKRILGLGESIKSVGKTNNDISYSALKEFQQIKSSVAKLAVDIENSDTLLDIVNNIFDNGINYIINEDELTYSQRIVLYTSFCIIEPSEDIYIIQNRCLVYEQIDENRINLQQSVGDEINNFNRLREIIGTKAESQCGSKDLNSINRAVDETYSKIMKLIGHIPNALDKLNKLDLEEFTNNQLNTILIDLKKLILFIENKCS